MQLSPVVSRVRQALVRQARDFALPEQEALTPEGLAGWCELSEAIAWHTLKEQGVAEGSLHSNQLQELLGGWRHAFLVVSASPDEHYLVDPTFGQFCGEGSLGLPGHRMAESHEGRRFAEQLRRDGFIRWDRAHAAVYETAFSGKPATPEFYDATTRSQRPMGYQPAVFQSLLK